MARAKKPSTTSDLVRSLLVIIVPLLIITYLFTRIPQTPKVQEVDWVPVLATARSQAPYAVLAPAAVPVGWRATRVSWVPEGRPYLNGTPSPRNYWQLGFLDAGGTYVELVQGDVQTDDLVAEKTRQGTPDGESPLGDSVWRRTTSPDGRTHALVLATAKVTTVVSGDVDYSELDAFASSLADH